MSKNAQVLVLLRQAFDALPEATADSDIDDFEDAEEEAQAVPAQYACRKIMQAMDLLREQNRAAIAGAADQPDAGRAYHETHEPPHCPTCECGAADNSST